MFLALFLLWFLFSGGFSVSTAVSGAIVSALITLFCRRYMGYDPRVFRRALGKSGAIVRYVLFLLREIFLANIAVIRMVYRREATKPLLVHFKSGLNTDAAKVLVANSITLTPGTYTVHLSGEDYCVHALDESFAVGLEACAFIQKAAKLEE